MHAVDEAALPVDAQAIRSVPACSAMTTPTALARSLRLADGLRPSSFTATARTPSHFASRSDVDTGLQPTEMGGSRASGPMGSTSRYRHWLRGRRCSRPFISATGPGS